ncbi:MAG: 2-hydroxyglutaryl-CoA dehydratase [Candidatus Nealsonbacteria bacterium]|nr:2-hydroxyglutaryl-CoA dehydratase [Candidatus Nealsonbacteria bacterium]
MKKYLGIDVGSISTKLVLVDENDKILYHLYKRTGGNPIQAVQEGLKDLEKHLEENNISKEIMGVGTTGSARQLAGVITGADLVKNEITAHAAGTSHLVPEVRTIIEIGGQDSKVIVLENGVAVDFAMNLICAAGTGSFLDAQAFRLGIPIEKFGNLALSAENPTNIASRCTVFCESDMIHKQQIGHEIEDIVAGLCQGLARNFLSSVAKGKDIRPPIVFLGGVSQNVGMRKAFEEALNHEVVVPDYNTVMGAFGAALLVKKENLAQTNFLGFDVSNKDIRCTSFQCDGCPNQCEVIEAKIEGKVAARWGDRCGKWSNLKTSTS